MGAALRLREDYSAEDLRGLACKARDGAQARRLMALAAVADGKRRAEAAAIGLMDRQTLRDWVVRFNAKGAEGLIDKTSPGRPPKLTPAQKQELRQVVEDGPEKHVSHLVRWRRADLAALAKARFAVDCHETTIGRMLRELGFSHISARPRHPEQDKEAIETFKKRMARPVRKRFLQSDPSSLRQRIRPRAWPWPRWRSARPGPHKPHGVERHFLSQVSRAPVDCQAISLPPPADIRCRAAPRATSGRSLLRRPDGRGIERFASP